MKSKFQRQGLVTNIEELKNIIKEVNNEHKTFAKKTKIKLKKYMNFQINIINKDAASDGWRFE